MAQRTKTIQNLLDLVADRADIKIDVANTAARHYQGKVLTRINQAIQRWQQLVAEAGDDAQLTSTRVTTNASATIGGFNWAPRQYLAQPSNMMLLRGMDIYPPGKQTPVEMMHDGSSAFWSDWSGWLTSAPTGMPVFYRLGGLISATGPIIQIFPWADAAYTVDIKYIPAWADSTNPADVVDFVFGGDEYVVNDAAVMSLILDGQGGGAAANACRGWNAKLEMDIKYALAQRSRPRKVDTRERRRALMAMSSPLWRGIP